MEFLKKLQAPAVTVASVLVAMFIYQKYIAAKVAPTKATVAAK